MTWIVVGVVAGFVAGSAATAVALAKDRKRVDLSRVELLKAWMEVWKKKAELDKIERELAARSGAYQGRAS